MINTRFRLTAAAVLVGSLLAGLSVWNLQPPVGAAVEPGPRTITVNGEGEVLAQPDMAVAGFGVEGRGATSQEAMARASEGMNRVLAAIKAAGIPDEDVTTTNISLFPEYGQGAPPPIVGYRASNTVNVKVRDLSRLVWVLDGAVAAGATYATGIGFGFNDDDELRRRALRAAARNARSKADALAEALGVTVSALQSVTEGGAGIPIPVAVSPGVRVPDAPSVPVRPGTQTITGQVTAVFTIG
jgi:hypothetical protein